MRAHQEIDGVPLIIWAAHAIRRNRGRPSAGRRVSIAWRCYIGQDTLTAPPGSSFTVFLQVFPRGGVISSWCVPAVTTALRSVYPSLVLSIRITAKLGRDVRSI